MHGGGVYAHVHALTLIRCAPPGLPLCCREGVKAVPLMGDREPLDALAAEYKGVSGRAGGWVVVGWLLCTGGMHAFNGRPYDACHANSNAPIPAAVGSKMC